jgi:hypothetical protein
MPIVPFTAAAGGSKPKQRQPLSAEQEPWALMAAAQMDAEGRLVEDEAPVGASEVNPNAT